MERSMKLKKPLSILPIKCPFTVRSFSAWMIPICQSIMPQIERKIITMAFRLQLIFKPVILNLMVFPVIQLFMSTARKLGG